MILLLTAIGTGIAALSILGHPGLLWLILAGASILNAVAVVVVILRRAWGRRSVLTLLGAQIAVALVGLIVVAVVEVRDLPSVDEAATLLVFMFVPVVAGIVIVSVIAAWSIRRLQWPDA